MSRIFPAAIAFAALVASPAAAQQARAEPEAAPAPIAIPEAPAVHRIMTLTWTEIRLPRSLATSPTSSARPASSARPQIFTLTWQDAVGRDTTSAIAAGAPQACTVTVLMTVPCSVQ